MSNVVVDITVSLDGYVTGSEPQQDRGLGINGERMHRWALDPEAKDDKVCCSTEPSSARAPS